MNSPISNLENIIFRLSGLLNIWQKYPQFCFMTPLGCAVSPLIRGMSEGQGGKFRKVAGCYSHKLS